MGIRVLNRKIQDFLRPKRLAFGRFLWDRKKKVELKSKEENIIENEGIKSILFIRNDGKIGDMIINTLMFREIKKIYPKIKIGVITRGANKQVIINNPNVDKIYDYDKSSDKLKKLAEEIANEKYDLLIDFSEMLRVKQMKFINLCKARLNMGLDKNDWNLFDISVKDSKSDKHITKRYENYLKVLGIEKPNLKYDIFIGDGTKERVRTFFKEINGEKLLVINPYGASKYRTLNFESIKKISERYLKKGYFITFVYPPDKLIEVEEFIRRIDNNKIYFFKGIQNIVDTAEIMRIGDLIISPDTSIVHLGVALDKEMVGIYRGEKTSNSIIWGPNSKKVKQIFSKVNKVVGNENDINDFNIEDF